MGSRFRTRAAIGIAAVLAGAPAAAADLRPDRVPGALRVPVRPMAVPPPVALVAAPVDPYEGLGLLQRLALLFSESFAPAQYASLAPTPAAAPAAAPSDEPSMEIIAYSGPLSPGVIVVNMTQHQIFRILEGGWAELHRNRTDVASFFKNYDSH